MTLNTYQVSYELKTPDKNVVLKFKSPPLITDSKKKAVEWVKDQEQGWGKPQKVSVKVLMAGESEITPVKVLNKAKFILS